VTGLGFVLGDQVKNVDHWIFPIIGVIILLSIAPGLYHMLRQPTRRQIAWNWVKNLFKKKT
jgi:hypothetical protein